MTDNEIIMAWRNVYNVVTNEKYTQVVSVQALREMGAHIKATLDLINRQKAENKKLQDLLVKNNAEIAKQESEIERLTINMNAFGLGMKREAERADNARAEAIKEFAERLKESKKGYEGTLAGWTFTMTELDNLAKEMVGDTE